MMERDFKRAWWQLVALYLVIIGSVIILFSLLTFQAAKDTLATPTLPEGSQVVINESEARALAMLFKPNSVIESQEYELQGNGLILTFVFEDGEEVKANLFNRNIYLQDDEHGSVLTSLTRDFDEHIIDIGVLVFLLASLCSAYVAHKTLQPINVNLRKQRQFVSGAAHELRNPLAALHARIELAIRQPKTVSPDLFEDLLSETKRLIAMSETLLSIERVEHTKVEKKLSRVQPAIDAVLHRLHSVIQDKGVQVTVDAEGALVRMPVFELETVLYNLVHNAVKFSYENGPISISARSGRISVRDEGIGIGSEEIPHIFERFYKVETARTEGGTGLGLALVNDIVTRHGGKIRVTSEPGKGTEILVIL